MTFQPIHSDLTAHDHAEPERNDMSREVADADSGDDRRSRDDLERQLQVLLDLINPDQQPNLNVLWRIAKEIPMISLNIKFFGYQLARQLAAALPVRTDLPRQHVGLTSKPSTQVDLEQDWAAYWAGQLQVPVVFHRKLWEFVYVLQAVYEHGMMQEGTRGVGFGCGVEPLPSLFASYGMNILVTDLPPEAQAVAGWTQTNQHTTSLESAYRPYLVSHDVFVRNVSLKRVDMNAIPDDLAGFDFCWSICALEHLGSIQRGLDFIENSLRVLRPGGLAVHTTEFNFLNDESTIDNWPTVLFQKRHFMAIKDKLTALGHVVLPLNFDVGSKPMDKFIDLPPFVHDWSDYMRDQWGAGSNHIKVSVDGFASTCFGIIVRRQS